METPPLSTNPETPPTPPASCCSPKIPACRQAGKLLYMSVGLVVLTIVATAGFLLGKYSTKPATSPSPTPQPFNMRGVLIATPTENPTANWKTYTSPEKTIHLSTRLHGIFLRTKVQLLAS